MYVKKNINLIITIGIPICFVLFLCSNEIIYIIGGAKFYDATYLIKILSPLTLIVGLSNIFGLQLLTSLSKDKVYMKIITSVSLLSIILYLFAAKYFNEIGIAISYVIIELLITIISIICVYKISKIEFPLKFFFTNIYYSIPIIAIYYITKSIFLNQFIFFIVFSILTFLLFIIMQIKNFKNELISQYIIKYNLKFLRWK